MARNRLRELYFKFEDTLVDYEYINYGCIGEGIYNCKKCIALIDEKEEKAYAIYNIRYNHGTLYKQYKKSDYIDAITDFVELGGDKVASVFNNNIINMLHST